MINPQITNLVIMLVMMQLSRRIDMDDETNILYIRVAYVASVALGWIVFQLARRAIVAKNDLTTLKYVKPASPLGGEGEKLEVTTVRDYDLQEIDSSIKSIYTGLAMMGFMHLYMKYTNPLFMQMISPIKTALEHNEVKIHLFGALPVGPLKRPFATQSMFGGASQGPKTDKKSIEAAERAGQGGVKRE
ncbi:PHO88 (YBR106W) [Zygosaccharomyces parabailii]|nr:PHO88 (YBR106W) [Zygosaccharomyces parabailii]CDH08609.1 probable Inorganic phosphate transport protein PHO88 [Zygosaccharomyces bailii ISA1307]